MNSNTGFRMRKFNVPKSGRFGRPLNRRDRLMGVAFMALLLFGLWWILRPATPYAVESVDLFGVLNYTEVISETTHDEFYGWFGQGDVVVIVGTGNNYALTMGRATVLMSEMISEGVYPDADLMRFSNAVVVCGVPKDCSSLASQVAERARERESRPVQAFN